MQVSMLRENKVWRFANRVIVDVEGCGDIPKLIALTILGYFSVRCSFISCDKTSTQKLSHSFMRLDISAIDNISNVLPLNLIKFCFHVTERLLKWPTYKWKVRSKKNQMKMQRGHSYNKSQNLSGKTAAGKRNFKYT